MDGFEGVCERLRRQTKWRIERYKNDEDFKAKKPYDVSEFEGNCLLNEGISRLHNLLTGGGGSDYGNATAYLGVGESSAGEDPAHTGLQGSSKTYKPMETTYPTYSAQKTTWRAVFGSADANNAWNEFTVVNASSDTGDNLNRKVSSQGTKTAGQTWTLDLEITWS